MPRKTKAQIEAERRESEERAAREALRSTEDVPTDLPIPQASDHTEGWTLMGDRVERGWSEAVSHGWGPYPGWNSYRSASRNGAPLYSTEERAWRAARRKVEREAGRKLAQIDREIARCAEAARRGGAR